MEASKLLDMHPYLKAQGTVGTNYDLEVQGLGFRV